MFTVTILESLKRVLCQCLEPCFAAGGSLSRSAPFYDSPGHSTCAWHIGCAVCSPKDTLFLVNHCTVACFKFPFLASLIQCPWGMSGSLWGHNRLAPGALTRHVCRAKLIGLTCVRSRSLSPRGPRFISGTSEGCLINREDVRLEVIPARRLKRYPFF